MKKRDLMVRNVDEAVDLMKSFLAANMLDNCLSADEQGEGNSKYHVILGRFTRDVDTNDVVGCPCFLCEYEGFLPNLNTQKALMYVKAFSSKNFFMTKMFFINNNEHKFLIEEIKNNDIFVMDDGRKYLYKDGQITLI